MTVNSVKLSTAAKIPRGGLKVTKLKGRAKSLVKTAHEVHKYIQYQVWCARTEDWSAADHIGNIAAWTGFVVVVFVILRALYLVYLMPDRF